MLASWHHLIFPKATPCHVPRFSKCLAEVSIHESASVFFADGICPATIRAGGGGGGCSGSQAREEACHATTTACSEAAAKRASNGRASEQLRWMITRAPTLFQPPSYLGPPSRILQHGRYVRIIRAEGVERRGGVKRCSTASSGRAPHARRRRTSISSMALDVLSSLMDRC